MLIPTHIEVFDDPEYCCHCPLTNKCFYLWHGHCTLRENNKKPDHLTIIENFFPLISVRHEDNLYYLKSKECRQAYQAELKRREALEEKKPEELDLEKELGKVMEKTLRPEQEPFNEFMSRQYPDIEYLCMFVDEKGIQKYPEMEILKGYDRDIVKTIKDDMVSLYGIEVSEVEKLRKAGEECEFNCEKYGLPKHSIETDCDKCPNTPPF